MTRSEQGNTDQPAKTSRTDPLPERPIGLLQRVVSGDADAWHRFVETYAGFVHALARRYARGDADLASELMLVALEGLRRCDARGRPFYRLRKYLDSLKRFGSRSRFSTWLALVVKNLLRDWFRSHQGRRLIPKEIAGLDTRGQELFRCLLWEGTTEAEAHERLRSRWPGLDQGEFDALLERLYERLAERNLFGLYRDLLRRLPSVSLDNPFADGLNLHQQLPDRRPASRPDLALERKRSVLEAARVGRLLKQAVDDLPVRARRVFELLALRGLTGEQVRRVMGFRKRQRVYDEMSKARKRIGERLTRAGVTAEDAQTVIGWLDGWLQPEKNNFGARSGMDVRHEQRVDKPVARTAGVIGPEDV